MRTWELLIKGQPYGAPNPSPLRLSLTFFSFAASDCSLLLLFSSSPSSCLLTCVYHLLVSEYLNVAMLYRLLCLHVSAGNCLVTVATDSKLPDDNKVGLVGRHA